MKTAAFLLCFLCSTFVAVRCTDPAEMRDLSAKVESLERDLIISDSLNKAQSLAIYALLKEQMRADSVLFERMRYIYSRK